MQFEVRAFDEMLQVYLLLGNEKPAEVDKDGEEKKISPSK